MNNLQYCLFSFTVNGVVKKQTSINSKGGNIMHTTTTAILSLLETPIPDADRELILKKIAGKTKLRLLTSREVMAILGISRPTLRAYCRQKLLVPIRYSPRKIRFDAAEIERFRCQGAKTAYETKGGVQA